jgi:phage host-nuclease inhibitor protein Gam
MIAENRYHRKKVKALIAERDQLKKKVAELSDPNAKNLDEIIEEQVAEIKTLKQQIKGYKMAIGNYKKKELKTNGIPADSGN